MPRDHDDPEAPWIRLGFEEAVLAEFAFLVREFGFRLAHSDPSLVRLESPNGVGVEVWLERGSFEISADLLRLRPTSSERFTTWEIARLAGAPGVTAASWLQASNRQAVAEGVAQLSELLRTYGSEALNGDERTLQGLRALQLSESDRFLAEGRATRARSALGKAWADRNYPRVVELLEGIADQLSPAEYRKLTYARKQLAAGS